MSDKTLNFAERTQAAEVIQGCLARNPEREKFAVHMTRSEAVKLIGTLRGHDLLDLGDDIYRAFGTEGALGDVVVDVLTRMDEEEYDAIVEFLRRKLLNRTFEKAEDLELGNPGAPVNVKSAWERLLEIHPGAVIVRQPSGEGLPSIENGARVPALTFEELMDEIDREEQRLAGGEQRDPGDETDAPATHPGRKTVELSFRGTSVEEAVAFLRQVVADPERYFTKA